MDSLPGSVGIRQGPDVQPAAAHCTLTTDVMLHVLRNLPPNEVACAGRLLCKELARRLGSPQHRAVHLGQPIPPYAAAWRCGEDALRQLSFQGRLGVLSTAASSGCEANMAVALRLVGPGLFPGVPPERYCCAVLDPGTAAARAGHAGVLSWMLAHHYPLHPKYTLQAVAEHCGLAALQAAWELLPPEDAGVELCVVAAAARSRTPDALGKLQWLVEEGCRLDDELVAEAAAEACNTDCLRWMQQSGWYLGAPRVLCAVLRHGSMDLVQWMWQQQQEQLEEQQRRGNPGQAQGWSAEVHGYALCAAGSGVEGVAKLRWLRGQGAELGAAALGAAARCGRLEAVRYLVEECGVAVEQEDGLLAGNMAEGGDVGVMQYLLQRGAARDRTAYFYAASQGDLATVQWLAGPGGYSCRGLCTAHNVAHQWPAAGSPGCGARTEEDCLAAVQAVLGAGADCDDELVSAAAGRGSLLLARWLVEEKGCAFAHDTLCRAAEGGSAAVLEWLVGRGGAGGSRVGREYVVPAMSADRTTLELLWRLGVPWDGAALGSVSLAVCEPPVLQWLVDHGMELEPGEVREAARFSRSWELQRWLLERVPEGRRLLAGLGAGAGAGGGAPLSLRSGWWLGESG